MMEALCFQPLVGDKVMMEEEEGGKQSGEEQGGATEASSPVESTTDEETEEDSEPEPPVVVRRKVSFADAFGLNLVSVKEFDNVEVTEAEVSQSPKGEATHPLQGFYMTCLFTVPSTPEELDLRLRAQMVELESIEFLPGTTTLRGIIRVVNLCYTKFVYARVSLDHWNSYFDLLAEYVPGSSDIKTDRFTFKYTLVPPFGREGTRVEFCLRYETSVGTFWANNKDMNYVLFCHQRGQMKEHGPQVAEESASYKSKRSCLKAKRRGNMKDKEIMTITAPTEPAETEAACKAVKGDRRTDYPDIQPLYCKEKRVVCSRRNPDRATREACVKDYLSQRRQLMPKAHSPDSDSGRQVSQPWLAPLSNTASFLYKRQKKHSNEVLTYHQIPLLTLDWNSGKQHEWENSDMDDFWTGGGKLTLAGALRKDTEERPAGNDMWESLLNGADENTDKGASVCEVWQAFLNGPGCKDHSGVPESEWLQTAASVSPSNHKEPHNRYASSSQGFQEFQVGMDTPTTLHAHTSAACQLLSATRESQLTDVALNAEDHQPEGCGKSTRDDNAVTQDASQRSQTKSVTDTPQEFSLKGATPVSEGSVDSSTKCHRHAIWGRGREEMIGEAEAIGEDEPFTPHIADLVTSSGESKTTDMTAMPEFQNARTVDRISQGARPHEGLSSSGEKDVTGTAHNATDDTLAFKETIRQGTKDGEEFVASTSRRAAEETIVMNCMENKVSTEEELFRPLKMEECEISQSYVDEKGCEEFRMNQKSENPLQENEENENEMGPVQPHADEFNPKQICEEDLKSETGEHVLAANQTEEGKCLSGITELLQETNPSSPTAHTAHSSDKIKVLQSDHDRIRPFSADKCFPNPVNVVKLRWTHPQKDEGGAISPEEITVKQNVARKDTLTEVQRQREPLERTEEYMSQRDEDERVSVGKLNIEAMGELRGDVDGRWEERMTTLAGLKEQELSAQVERHQPVECKILCEGTKDPITAENTAVIESGLDGMLVERFAEGLVREICEEVFSCKESDCNRDTNIVAKAGGGTAGMPDITQECHSLAEKGFNDASDSAIFSFSTGANLRLCQGPKPTTATRSTEHSRKEKSQSLTTADQTHSLTELLTDFNSSARLSQDLVTTLGTQSRPSLTKSAPALGSGKDQEGCYQIKKRSAAHQETGGQTEACVGAQKERFNQAAHPSHKHVPSSSETFKESSGLIWWSILYSLSHISRLVIGALLVAGCFVLALLYDLPAFFALYVFSLCYWLYKWRRRQAAANKAMTG